jgi:dCMP deaminase
VKRITLEEVFIEFAFLISKRSTCLRQQNGAVLVSPDYLHIWGFGYNGSARKTPHNCSNQEGNCSCIHAELNALLKAQKTKGGILFCTTSPCMECAKAILNAEVSCVIFKNVYRIPEPIDYLNHYGVICKQWNKDFSLQ